MKKFFYNIKRFNKYAIRSAKAELRSEVADSHLNWLWWVIEPLCFMILYTFIFSVFFKNNTPFFASFVFIGLTIWDFFNRMISQSVKLISTNRDIVTKVYLPKYILLIAKSYTYLFKMGISFVICFILMFFQGVHFSWHIVFMIPILCVLYLVSFGLGTILMHFGVTVSDLSNLINIVMRMVMYLSGVFFDIRARISGPLQFIILKVNPSAFLMSEMRSVLLNNAMPSFLTLGAWALLGLGFCVLGIHLIHKNENSYAKVI